DRRGDELDDPFDVGLGDDERRREQNVIPGAAVDGATHGIGQQPTRDRRRPELRVHREWVMWKHRAVAQHVAKQRDEPALTRMSRLASGWSSRTTPSFVNDPRDLARESTD